jgi:hypothetical protein
LQLGIGITGNWEKIAVIDTENDSASLYSHLGPFKTLRLDPPYTPDRYIEAIENLSRPEKTLHILCVILFFLYTNI